MDGATACAKYVIFTINFILFLMGGAILGIGIWIRSNSDFWEYHNNLDIPQYYQACYISIAIGLFLLIIAFFGCCGAYTGSPCMLFTYFAVLVVLIILELTVAAIVWKQGDGDRFQEFLTQSIKKHIDNREHNFLSARFIDLLQLHMQCCGGYDRTDYYRDSIPQSCSSDRTNNIFYHGCGENLRRYLEQRAGMVGGISLGIILIQIMALMFTGCLYMTVREEDKFYTKGKQYLFAVN